MRLVGFLPILFGAALATLTAVPARAQGHNVELGTSLVGATIGMGDNELSTFGVPSAGLGLLSPSVYLSIFAGPHLAIEPQIGLVWARSSQGSYHFLSLAGQVDYFLRDKSVSSPYVFGTVGVVDVTDAEHKPTSFGGGGGYRILVGG